MKVEFHESADDALLKFAVIVSRYQGKWVFCKHKKRNTWEVPGGHREEKETVLETAQRELYEETGATVFELIPVCVYSCDGSEGALIVGAKSYGMLYFAEIAEMEEELHSEIERVFLFEQLPERSLWTYPEIQPKLVEEVCRRAGNAAFAHSKYAELRDSNK